MLTKQEQKMMDIFLEFPNKVINHKYFVTKMFGGYGSKDSVKAYVCVLRKKTKLTIRTHYRKGYELVFD